MSTFHVNVGSILLVRNPLIPCDPFKSITTTYISSFVLQYLSIVSSHTRDLHICIFCLLLIIELLPNFHCWSICLHNILTIEGILSGGTCLDFSLIVFMCAVGKLMKKQFYVGFKIGFDDSSASWFRTPDDWFKELDFNSQNNS